MDIHRAPSLGSHPFHGSGAYSKNLERIKPRGKTKPLLARLVITQVMFLAGTGGIGDAGPYHAIGPVTCAAVTLRVMVKRVELNVPGSYLWCFNCLCCFPTGGAILGGLLGQFIAAICL